ncbi:sulfotransferase family [Fragilaria crotonensis]|nr:sulfotransferase family [Fragilaria crotonensis]
MVIASKSTRQRCCRWAILIKSLIVSFAFLSFLALVMSTIVVFKYQDLENANAIAFEGSFPTHPSLSSDWKNLRKRHEQRLNHSEIYSAPSNVLEFVHITKTGGTAVEAAAAAANITWGLCHFEFQKQLGPACMRPNWAHLVVMEQRKKNETNATNSMMPYPPWHSPTHWLALVEPSSKETTTITTTTPVTNPYQGSKTFTIVRNPYDRIISEYYCKYFGFHREEYQQTINKHKVRIKQLQEQSEENDDQDHGLRRTIDRKLEERCNRDTLEWERRHRDDKMARIRARRRELEDGYSVNMAVPSCRHLVLAARIQEKLPPQSRQEIDMARFQRDKRRVRPRKKDTHRSFNFWILRVLTQRSNSMGHLLPQHYYVYDSDGNQVIDHVIRFENITSEFDELMRLYGLNVTLSQNEKINQGHQSAEGMKFSTKDFTQQTLALINEVYRKDFELLGYPTMTTSHYVEPGGENEDLDLGEEEQTAE